MLDKLKIKKAPQLWDAIRYEVDHRDGDGQFILTGSAVPKEKDKEKIQHSGAGRFTWLRMRPMSLWESQESTGEVSLAGLFAGNLDIEGFNRLTMDDIAFLTCRGGWPKSLNKKTEKAALEQVMAYYDAITRSDISRVDDVDRDEQRAKRLMRSYARMQGGQVSIGTITVDMQANEANTMSDVTIASYLNALRKMEYS